MVLKQGDTAPPLAASVAVNLASKQNLSLYQSASALPPPAWRWMLFSEHGLTFFHWEEQVGKLPIQKPRYQVGKHLSPEGNASDNTFLRCIRNSCFYWGLHHNFLQLPYFGNWCINCEKLSQQRLWKLYSFSLCSIKVSFFSCQRWY